MVLSIQSSQGGRRAVNHKNKKVSLFAADDDSVIRELVKYYATRAGISHELFETGDELLGNLHEEIQVCLLDLDMPGSGGIACLERIKHQFPQIEVIILTSNNQASDAMEAIRKGAFDYVTKPFDPEELINCIRNARLLNTKHRENNELRSSLSESKTHSQILGVSAAMQELQEVVTKVAQTPNPILITGESGTGKTLLARNIHSIANSDSDPFVCVSCPSIPKELLESEMFGHEKGAFSGAANRKLGKVELANKGTLFLDEIGEMSLSLQAKLLNFLQDKSFYRVGGEKLIQSQTRIIAATNKNLKTLVKQGLFREDLFFRLNVLPVEMPSLRDREGDIPLLLQYFLLKCAKEASTQVPETAPEVVKLLENYPWPGNVRELEHATIRAFTMRANPNRLGLTDFSFLSEEAASTPNGSAPIPDQYLNPMASLRSQLIGKPLNQIENIIINETIEYCDGNKAKAAKILGIAEKSIYNKLKRFKA